MGIQAAVFDMDGTLLDSMEGWATAGERYLRRRGLIPRGGKADSLLYQGMEGTAAQFQIAYGIMDDQQTIINGIRTEVAAFYETRAVPREGVETFLQALRDCGVRMCVATATDRCLAEPTLERLGLLPFFERLFTCSELHTDKTRPLIYDTAAAFLGAPKEATWIFEDAAYAVCTAKTAGYPVCAVYDRFEPCAEVLKHMADHYVLSYRDAMQLTF